MTVGLGKCFQPSQKVEANNLNQKLKLLPRLRFTGYHKNRSHLLFSGTINCTDHIQDKGKTDSRSSHLHKWYHFYSPNL